ncbi:hypothetical protein HDE_06189 [Halotydeus destructor]|nr:hypothetical protein HDE_06189 [Halotydeus destructor]
MRNSASFGYAPSSSSSRPEEGQEALVVGDQLSSVQPAPLAASRAGSQDSGYVSSPLSAAGPAGPGGALSPHSSKLVKPMSTLVECEHSSESKMQQQSTDN